MACFLFVFSTRRLVVPHVRYECEGTPLFFSAPRAVRVGNKAQRKVCMMDLNALLVIVVGNDDHARKVLEREALNKFPSATFGFVHYPIGNNSNIMMNGFYDCLKNSTCEHVMVLNERVVADEGRMRKSLDEYEANNGKDPKKPLLKWRINEPAPVWSAQYDFACEIVVSSRASLFDAQKAACGVTTEDCSTSTKIGD